MHADTHCTGPIESVQILLKGHSSCCVLIFVFSVEYFLCLQFERAFKRIFNKNKNHSRKVALRRNKSGIQDRRKVKSVYKRKRKKSHSLKRRPVQCFSKSVKEIKSDQKSCNNIINNEKSSLSETKLRFTVNMHKTSSQNGIMTLVDIHKDRQGKIKYYPHVNKHCFWVSDYQINKTCRGVGTRGAQGHVPPQYFNIEHLCHHQYFQQILGPTLECQINEQSK